MIFKSFDELLSFRNSYTGNLSKLDINELLKLPGFSGVFHLNFQNKEFDYINIGNDDGGILKFFWQGEPEIISMKLWCSVLDEHHFALDIGANTGRYSVIGGKFGGDIIAFEPYIINYCRLIDNLKINNLNYKNTLMIGLSNTNSEGFLKIKSPLYYKSAGGKISNTGNKIKLAKLDDIKFNKPINIMKIDVEGHENQVIDGALGIIDKFRPNMIIEYNKDNFMHITNLLTNKFKYNYFLIDDKNRKILEDKNIISLKNFEGNIMFYQDKNVNLNFQEVKSNYV